jgi:hypothetical protein
MELLCHYKYSCVVPSLTKFGPVVAISINKREVETEAEGEGWTQGACARVTQAGRFNGYLERQTPRFYRYFFYKKFSIPGCGPEKRKVPNSSTNGGPESRFTAFRFNYAAIVLRRFTT